MPLTTPEQAGDYYQASRRIVEAHLAGREVILSDPTGPGADASAQPSGLLDDLTTLRAIPAAIGLADGFVALHAEPGDGADIATAATAVLALAEAMQADGLSPVALTDGGQGLYLAAVARAQTEPDPRVAAWGYAERLADRSPELGTTDPGAADGRTLLTAVGAAGLEPLPAPYSLVRGDDGTFGAIIPLTLDEVAATTAGMPLELEPGEVAARLATRGDLAGALTVR